MNINNMKKTFREEFNVMTFYEKFEQVIALILTFVISIVVIASLYRLIENAYSLLILGLIDPIQPQSFQTIFGMIMTLLIALEFKHSILKVVMRRESIIQVKTVVLIALLAVSRKFIILDIEKYSASTILALAASLLALGIVYWLIRERDDRDI
jgi:uncharacterized membrane protein (DUF373 family)